MLRANSQRYDVDENREVYVKKQQDMCEEYTEKQVQI